MNTAHKKYRPFHMFVNLDLITNFLIYLGSIMFTINLFFPKYEVSEFVFVAIMLGLILWQFPDEESVQESIADRVELVQGIKQYFNLTVFVAMLVVVGVVIGLIITFLYYMMFQSIIVSVGISTTIFATTIITGIKAYKADI